MLLRNDGALPLSLRPGQTLAVVGEFARTPRYQGAGSSQVNPTRVDVALDELRAGVPTGVEVRFAPGFGGASAGEDDRLADEAVALAADAAATVVFLGLPASAESEGFDRTHMDLPPEQVALLRRVADVSHRVVVVLANGSAVTVSPWDHRVSAVLECWLSGQAAGGAVADLLLGHANPSGRLAETIPRRLEDSTAYLNFPGDSGHVRYGEGVFVGYRGHDRLVQEVAYPFGHGLSYTSFAYDGLVVEQAGSHAEGDLRLTVTCRVTNSGQRAGAEVVQLYVGDVEASVARPVRELKGFRRVHLEPGESATVELDLVARDLSFWSEVLHAWVLEAGDFEIGVGASSRDLRLHRTVRVDAPRVAPPLEAMSTLEEWLDDPAGAEALADHLGLDEHGRLRGPLGDEELVRVIGNFPMSALAGFPIVDLDHAGLADLVARVRPPAG